MFSKHQWAHSFGHSHNTLEWTLPLYEVYNAEINMLRRRKWGALFPLPATERSSLSRPEQENAQKNRKKYKYKRIDITK